MLKTLLVGAILACAITGVSQTACSNMTLGQNGALNGFVPSPNDAWHQDISTAPIDPQSAKIIATAGDLGGAKLHPDFGSVANGNYGIPYTVVDSAATPSVPVAIQLYPSDSDIAVYPVPSNLPIEGSPGQCPTDGNDRHAIIVDRNQCVAYELYQAAHCSAGWSASSSAIWDFTKTESRPYGLTSVDAAGLSVFEGLIRYDEIVAGVINHAIRFTAQHTKDNANNGLFVVPATHAAGNNWSTDNIMGMRIRLQASFDISKYSATNQIILRAMKQYGMILADNGSNLFFQGTPDARWNDSDLSALKVIPATAFEVVHMGTAYDAQTAPKGTLPVISSFTASASTIPAGSSVTLTPVISGGTYSYIDKVGFVRGAVTVTPSVTTTYLLTTRNSFGTATKSVTVTVTAGQITPTLTFAAIAGQTYGAAPFAVSATSASTGTVTYTVVSGPATVAGNTVTINGVGTVSVQASQAAAGSYTAATATTSFTVVAASPSLAFVTIPSQVQGGPSITVSTTTNSGGSISYSVVSGPATIAGNVVTTTGTGTATLQATQAAAGNYTSATATTTFSVTAAAATAPTIAFAAIANQIQGAAPFAVAATSNSTGAILYSVVSGPASISGNVVTVTGVGTVTLLASQAAAGAFTAGTATTSFSVTAPAAVAPTLAFAGIGSKVQGAAPFTVSATSNSTGAISYSLLSGPATVAGNVVTVTGVGTVTLLASQAAAGNYTAGTTTTSFSVTAAVATQLAFVPIPNQVFGVAPFQVSAVSPSPGAITYSVTGGSATMSGNTVSIQGAQLITLQATQVASGTYPAALVTTTFLVTPAVPNLVFVPVASASLANGSFKVSASSASWGTVTYTIVSGPATIVYGRTIVPSATGVVTIMASQPAAGNYSSATAMMAVTILP